MSTLSKNKIEESESLSDKERTVLYNSFMNAPAGIAILKGATHIFEFANTVYEKLIERPVAIGKTVREVLPEIEQQGLWHILDNAFATGEPLITNELPVDLKRKEDGILEKRYLNLVVQPLKDEKGNTERLLAHVIDVTKQVQAQKLIETSEAKFHNLILQAPVAIATFQGPSFIIETINKLALEIWGKSYGQVINKPLFEVSPETEDGLKKIFSDIYTTGEPFIPNEYMVQLKRQGKPDKAYFNSVLPMVIFLLDIFSYSALANS
jgi:PAS domain S-box-containing protein